MEEGELTGREGETQGCSAGLMEEGELTGREGETQGCSAG